MPCRNPNTSLQPNSAKTATKNAISNPQPHSRQAARLAPWTPTPALRRPRHKVYKSRNGKGLTEFSTVAHFDGPTYEAEINAEADCQPPSAIKGDPHVCPTMFEGQGGEKLE